MRYPKIYQKQDFFSEEIDTFALISKGGAYSVIGQYSTICNEYIEDSYQVYFKRWKHTPEVLATIGNKSNSPIADFQEVKSLLRDLIASNYKLSKLQTEYLTQNY